MSRSQRQARRRRRRGRRGRRTAPGASPGTLVVDHESPGSRLHAIAYGPGGIEERDLKDPAEVRDLLARWPVTWLNVDGLGDEATLRATARQFDLHPLALEDVVNTGQRPKVEQYPGHQFVVLRMAGVGERIETEQLSLFLGERFVLTFQERPGDCFDPVRERVRGGRGRARQAGPDYLAYALIDAVVDHYFPVLEQLGERVEALEDEVVERPGRETVHRIHEIKRDLVQLRRSLWPKREALNVLAREAHPLIQDETRVFLRDCYDHAIQLMDLVETYRELASGLMDVYLTSISNRTNEVMRVLTIIATIFIPLSFVASLYGMNFDREASALNMPELGWRLGYPFALLVMALVAGGMLLFFRRRGWLGGNGADGSLRGETFQDRDGPRRADPPAS